MTYATWILGSFDRSRYQMHAFFKLILLKTARLPSAFWWFLIRLERPLNNFKMLTEYSFYVIFYQKLGRFVQTFSPDEVLPKVTSKPGVWCQTEAKNVFPQSIHWLLKYLEYEATCRFLKNVKFTGSITRRFSENEPSSTPPPFGGVGEGVEKPDQS